MQVMDVGALPLDDNAFDLVICNHVLEHIPDDAKAMSELYRVLRPGGEAILQVPISLNLDRTYEDFSILSHEGREREFGQEDHCRIYGTDYRDRLELAGFTVRPLDPVGAFGEDIVRRYALLPEEKLYICSKPLSGADTP